MLEARTAMVHATKNSLLLFDEIGRGTSTYDGMALAQAIIEHIHDHIGALTLFSTHYHELTTLDKILNKLKNVHVRAVEQNGKVVFLHKVVEGPADRSYGIHVAELAEMPKELITRARVILNELEKKAKVQAMSDTEQLNFFEVQAGNPADKDILDEIATLKVMEMSPLDALNTLYSLQKKLK